MARQKKLVAGKESGTVDMTRGNPVRHILTFAVPLFIGNIFQQVYNIVDTMVAGYNLGDLAIGAIGATATLYTLLVNFANGLNNGFGMIVARYFGAKDSEKLKSSIAAMVTLNSAMTLLLSVISLLFLRPLMRGMNVPDSIFEEAYGYIAVIVAGMTVTILYNMCAGILRAVGNSKIPLCFLVLACILNLFLDVLFIMGLGRGVEGAAMATVIAQGISAFLAGRYIWKHYREILPGKADFRFEASLLKEMLGTGLSMAAMLCMTDLGSVLYQRAINGLGDTLIVAHAAARKIITTLMMPLASIATASSTFVSQNFGAKQYAHIEKSIWKVLGMEVLWGVFSCILVYLFGSQAVRFLTNTQDAGVIENAVLSIRIQFPCYPALGILLCLRTSLQAMGSKLAPVMASGFELAGKIITGFILIPAFGYIWVCLTEPIIWVVCMAFLIAVFVIKNPLKKAMEQAQIKDREEKKKGMEKNKKRIDLCMKTGKGSDCIQNHYIKEKAGKVSEAGCLPGLRRLKAFGSGAGAKAHGNFSG